MSVGLPSDEIAEDYKNSLEDLTANSRLEINNLTVIAKENTEHAVAISRVLENHIKNTAPDRKLYPLYVLDSIAKNVGTPYTIFLGRNLRQIFLDAYSLVSNQTRRKLDEMLKTWKEPVPGSLDPNPVFPADTTRPIETALIKWRTTAIQQQQQQQARIQQEMMRSRPVPSPSIQGRYTPTPPQQYFPPPMQVHGQPSVPNGNSQSRPLYSQQPQSTLPQHIPQSYQPSYPQVAPYSQISPPSQNLASLSIDIAELVKKFKDDFAANPYDDSLRTRLKALVDLQMILSKQQLPPQQLQAVRDQVSQLSAGSTSVPGPSPYIPPSQPTLPVTRPYQPPSHIPTPQNAGVQSSLDSRNLADIIAKAQRAPSAPPSGQSFAPPLSVAPASQPSAPPIPGSDLMAMLRAKGMLPTDPNTSSNGAQGYSTPPPAINSPLVLPTGLIRSNLMSDVELTSTSLKIPRPHLISTLYEGRPSQCALCGRRFLMTTEGREKKARHLDWHFRTKQRLAEAAKRGQSRSWYVDELEWIKSRDNPEEAPVTELSSTTATAALAALAASNPRNKHVPVPADPALANQPCPICQEKFETVWNDETQDFVWMDAVKVGNRIFHASCRVEIKKDGGNTPLRTNTPDSVLGKRKVGIDQTTPNAKVIKA